MARYGNAEIVPLPRHRYDELVENTLRLERVMVSGEGLIAEGVVVQTEERD